MSAHMPMQVVPQSAFPELGQGQAGRAQPLDTGQEGLGPAGPGRPLSSPLRLDRLAMFHDMVTSPEVVPEECSVASCRSPVHFQDHELALQRLQHYL